MSNLLFIPLNNFSLIWTDVDIQQGQPIQQGNIRGYQNTSLPPFHSQWRIAMDLATKIFYKIIHIFSDPKIFNVFNIGKFCNWGKQLLIISQDGTVGQYFTDADDW